VIVNLNQVNLLRKCLDSLRAQTLLPSEVIVVDNGSSDGSPDMVAREFPEVVLLPLAANHGFCGANNRGIERATGDYIALLNNDAEADSQWLAALTTAMDADEAVGMVAAKILVAGRPGIIDKVGHGIYFDGQNRGVGSGQPDRGQFDHAPIAWPDGCAALYRRRLFEQIGGFDEDFFAYADDAELGLRARTAGWKAVLAPAAIVHHQRGSTLGKYSAERIRLIERNRLWLAIIHFPIWLLVWNPLFYALRLAAGFWSGLRGRGEAGQVKGFRAKMKLAKTLLAADLEALLALPRVWRKRQQWRARRRWNDREVFRLLYRHRLSLAEMSHSLA
jgi:GT2 family glycosyltransferase